jgi:hypothetical protein
MKVDQRRTSGLVPKKYITDQVLKQEKQPTIPIFYLFGIYRQSSTNHFVLLPRTKPKNAMK